MNKKILSFALIILSANSAFGMEDRSGPVPESSSAPSQSPWVTYVQPVKNEEMEQTINNKTFNYVEAPQKPSRPSFGSSLLDEGLKGGIIQAVQSLVGLGVTEGVKKGLGELPSIEPTLDKDLEKASNDSKNRTISQGLLKALQNLIKNKGGKIEIEEDLKKKLDKMGCQFFDSDFYKQQSPETAEKNLALLTRLVEINLPEVDRKEKEFDEQADKAKGWFDCFSKVEREPSDDELKKKEALEREINSMIKDFFEVTKPAVKDDLRKYAIEVGKGVADGCVGGIALVTTYVVVEGSKEVWKRIAA